MFKYGIEVKLNSDFGIIAESLCRMGIANIAQRKLWQTAHILHKRKKFYIMHFKEMYLLDGSKKVQFTEEDKIRRTLITKRLESWGMVTIVDDKNVVDGSCNYFILKYKQRYDEQWSCNAKYTIGVKKS